MGRAEVGTRVAGVAAALVLGACGAPEREFDGSRAFAALETQVRFGPRVPGSPAHAQTLEWIEGELKPLADRVSRHSFDTVCPIDSSQVTFHNVVAVFAPENRRRILFGAHWDSRPRADEDPDEANRSRPVPGANDGASGIAVLLEVARALRERPPAIGVDLVLFDGEDCGRTGEPETFALGSQRFVADHPSYRPGYVVILDMVGRRGARFAKEANSASAAPQLVAAVWAVAREEGIPALVDSIGLPYMDDHVPFLRARIPAVDIIDGADPAWHTIGDLPGNCSPETLAQAGRLVLALIARAERAQTGADFPP